MKTIFFNWTKVLSLIVAAGLFQECSSSSNDAVGTGETEFQVTDAPSDDASVKGVFVTIADIKVDGTSISGFTKQTVDLKAFQEGNAKLLASSRLSAKSYNNVTLVLDNDTDASGTAPGSYVLTTTDAKFKLGTGQTNVSLNNTWNVTANSKTTVILDFDIRKAVRRVDDASIRYSFVSNDNLQASVRIVAQEKSGHINGNYTEQVVVNDDKIFVYAYKKGTFDAGVEGQPQGSDGILFKNAVTSAEVKGSLSARTYKLAFLESGEYELHFATYDIDANDQAVFHSMLQSNITVGASSPNVVTIQAGVTASLTTAITGL